MIVVLGRPIAIEGPSGTMPAGLPSAVAIAAAGAGAQVELIGTIGDDAAGDAVAIGLARAGVGHAALLRVPAATRPIGRDPAGPPAVDPADIELGLRYLPDARVIVVAEPLIGDAARVVAEAAEFAGAAVIVLVTAGMSPDAAFGRDVIVLQAPDDALQPFADAVGRYAAALDAGAAPQAALAAAAGAAGWERTGSEPAG